MITTIIASILSFALTALLGPLFIPFLKRLKYGQSIKEDGPSWHKAKEGTPTMGGIIFILAIAVVFAIFGMNDILKGNFRALSVIICALLFGVIGFVDDFIKVALKRNLGLTSMQKLIMQILVSIAFLLYLTFNNYLVTAVTIPFTQIQIELSYWYYVLALPFMVYTVNAVNLTDGVDGLATSVMIPVITVFTLIALNSNVLPLAVLSGSVIGGCFGFLLFNFYPAKIFMGDTGSLFLGGILVSLFFALNKPLLLIIAAFVFIFEALSVVIQVVYFKFTKKRIFKMSPIHHHFEMSQWSEVKIVYIFTLCSAIVGIIAFIAA